MTATYADASGRGIIADKWDGGDHPDVRMDETCAFIVCDGRYQMIEPGDFIVTYPSGRQGVWPPSAFHSVYTPVCEPEKVGARG